MNKSAKTISVIVRIVAVILLLQLFLLCQFKYVDTWKGKPDFAAYEAEFVVVRDYVKAQMNGQDGYLRVRYSQEKKYYYLEQHTESERITLECPENVKKALAILCEDAFNDSDVYLDRITCRGDIVAFESPFSYKLVYSPNEKPTFEYNDKKGIVLCSKIRDGWYNISLWTL